MSPSSSTIKVLSYNIHKGFTASNRYYVLDQIRQGIRDTDADLVFLQEVVGWHIAHPGKIENYSDSAQFEYLADGVWPHHAYGKNAVYTEGHHGNAILSKYPIERWHNLDISTNTWESRGLLHAKIKVSETQSFHAFAAHLGLFGEGRRLQVENICRYINLEVSPDEPIIFGGDFNDWRKKVSPVLLKNLSLIEAYRSRHGEYAATFPSRMPFFCLDRIYVRGLTPVDARVLGGGVWSKLSDHLALYAELKI